MTEIVPCSACGTAPDSSDLYCTQCGLRLKAGSDAEGSEPKGSGTRSHKHRSQLVVGAIAVAVLGAGAVVWGANRPSSDPRQDDPPIVGYPDEEPDVGDQTPRQAPVTTAPHIVEVVCDVEPVINGANNVVRIEYWSDGRVVRIGGLMSCTG